MKTRPGAYQIDSVHIALAVSRRACTFCQRPATYVPKWWHLIQRWLGPRCAVHLLLLLLLAGPAHASVVYDWAGTCATTCTGAATLHVVTTDAYVPGTQHDQRVGAPPVLLEARYADGQIAVDLAPLLNGVSGYDFALPSVSGIRAGDITIEGIGFFELPDGTWRMGGEALAPGCQPADPPPTNQHCSYRATGSGGTWTYIGTQHYGLTAAAVPGPATLVLLLAGGAAAWLSRRQ